MPKELVNRIIAAVCVFAITFLSVYAVVLGIWDQNAPQTPASESQKDAGTDKFPELWQNSDSVAPVSQRHLTILVCGVDNSDLLTDVIMLMSVNLDSNQVRVLRIPRDSYVGEQYPSGKINAVAAYPSGGRTGMEELKMYLQWMLQIEIDHYATVSLDGIRAIVDSMGGVEVDIPQAIYYLPGKTLEPGVQILDGEKAEWFIRYRAGYYDADLGRIDAQNLFIKALIEQVRKNGKLEAIKLIAQNYKYVETDIPLGTLVSLGNEAFEIESEAIVMYTAQGYGQTVNGLSVYVLDRQSLADILNEEFRPGGNEVGAASLNLVSYVPDPKAIEAEAVYGQEEDFTE